MKIAIIGSRTLSVPNLGDYLPSGVTEILSGGARGVDQSARQYAIEHGVRLREFMPEYRLYGKNAPLMRNVTIVHHADLVLAFWDGRSKGTKYVADVCERDGVAIMLYVYNDALKQFVLAT